MRGTELDMWLSEGYFRMRQEVFTCQFVPSDDGFLSAFWLRIVLADVQYGPKQNRLLRINEPFTSVAKPFVLTRELETLYATYRASLNFDTFPSVQDCLFGEAFRNRFDTQLIEVRDNGRLIAAGVFDNGSESIMGILNFYDPQYAKHSLGKYLMLLKIYYAQQTGRTFYYPGYLVVGNTKFDYKLFPCKAATEVYDDNTGQWLPFDWDTVNALTADRMREFGL